MKIAHLLFDGDHLYRLEEAETNLVAKQEANALLNSQVDILTKQLKELQAGKAAYEKHVRDLTALLTKERRKHVTEPEQVAWNCLHSVLRPKTATLQSCSEPQPSMLCRQHQALCLRLRLRIPPH